jgi:hypothetical protein
MSRATARLLSLAFLVLFSIAAAPARAGDVVAARADLYATYAAQLEKLATECQEQKQREPTTNRGAKPGRFCATRRPSRS